MSDDDDTPKVALIEEDAPDIVHRILSSHHVRVEGEHPHEWIGADGYVGSLSGHSSLLDVCSPLG